MSKQPPRCTLLPINLRDDAEYEQLHSQRVTCGWYNEPRYLERWRQMIDCGTKSLFWIMKEEDSPRGSFQEEQERSPSTQTNHTRAGHISLDSETEHSDPSFSLAHPSKSLLTISTFFILPKFQSRGLGRAAMLAVESLAQTSPYGSPLCEAIAITSLSRKYVVEEDWKEEYSRRLGMEPISFEDWYARLGYVKWKEEPYIKEVDLNGEDFWLVEAFMKKTLKNGN